MGTVYNILYSVLSVISWVVMSVVDAVFDLLYKNSQKTVSHVTDPFLLQPATVLADKIRSREYRAEDVMASFIARAKEVNVLVNAIVGEQYEKALQTARRLDETLDSLSKEEIEQDYGKDKKPFLGVPLSVKEAFGWVGMSNTSGLICRKHIRSTKNAPVLANLMDAGAIPFIQTNISELCMWFESSNYVYGCTNNAYNTSRMVGGSSGGEGCIISTGASVFGIGSDVGGSIRMPCFFNGIFGHKTIAGRIKNDGQWPNTTVQTQDLLATGPMCRYATDLIPAIKVMAGPEQVANLKLDTKVDIKKLRVISVEDDSGALTVSKVDPQLKDIQKKVVEYLHSKGAQLSEKAIHEFRLSFDMWAARMNLDYRAPQFSVMMAGHNEGSKVNCVKELFKSMLRMSQHTLPAIMLGMFIDYIPQYTKDADLRSVQILAKLKEELLELLGDDGVMLYPSHPQPAPYHNHALFTPFNYAYTALFNALNLPVTQVPLGLSKEGIPMGIQVVTSPDNDHLSLSVAAMLEEGFGGWVNPGSK